MGPLWASPTPDAQISTMTGGVEMRWLLGLFTTCVVQRSEIVNPRWAQRQSVVHIVKWIGITRREAEEFMKSWGAGTLAPPNKRMRPIEDIPEIDHHPSTSAKSAPATRPATVVALDHSGRGRNTSSHGRHKHSERGRSEERRKPETRRHRRSRKKEDDKPQEEPGEKKRRRRSSPRKDIKSEVDYDDLDPSASYGDDSEKEEQAEEEKSKSHKVKPVETPRVSALRKPITALDSLLDDDGKDPLPDGVAGSLELEANKKLKTLRDSLEKKRVESSKTKGPGAVLADRAAEIAKTQSKDRRRKSKGKEFVNVLRKALTSKSSRSRGRDEKAEGAEEASSSYDSDESSQEFAAWFRLWRRFFEGCEESAEAEGPQWTQAWSPSEPGLHNDASAGGNILWWKQLAVWRQGLDTCCSAVFDDSCLSPVRGRNRWWQAAWTAHSGHRAWSSSTRPYRPSGWSFSTEVQVPTYLPSWPHWCSS